MCWQKLSSSINYFIRYLCGESLLEDNVDLLDQYIDEAFEEDDGVYRYLDKKTFEYIKLSDEDLEKIRKTFLERIEKKKVKYADQIDAMVEKAYGDSAECLDRELKNKLEGFKVIEFSRRK